MHGNAPYEFFIIFYVEKGEGSTGKELLSSTKYDMVSIGSVERGHFMDTFAALYHSGTMQVYAIIFVMPLIYVAICSLEWRLSQKEEWWKGIILPILFLLLGRGGRLFGIILLAIYGIQRFKLEKLKKETQTEE